MSSIKKTIYIISAVCLVFMFAFYKLFVDNRNDVCLFMGILFMTAAYHLIVRLVIGTFGDAALEKGIDPDNHWFADSNAEQSVYRAIGVKSWKNKLPAPEPWKFSVKRRSLEDIVAESCRTEVVHEAGVIASLLSVLLTVPFGYLWFFILTAVLGGIFDLVFIIVQRYNRPRLMRTAAKKRMLFFEKLEYDNAFAEFEGADDEAANNESADNEDEPQTFAQDLPDPKSSQDPQEPENPDIPEEDDI
ncbi:MAG: hypothetical protein K2N56_09855 [Oscillospiraceae bacterium]|nr:hypothetical protein [Oscillospiraceae bacterium]